MTPSRLVVCLWAIATVAGLPSMPDALPHPSDPTSVLLERDEGVGLVSREKTDVLPLSSSAKVRVEVTPKKAAKPSDTHVNTPENVHHKSVLLVEKSRALHEEELVKKLHSSLPPFGTDGINTRPRGYFAARGAPFDGEEGLDGAHAPFEVDFVITWHNPNDEDAVNDYNRRLAQADKSKLPPGTGDHKRFTDAGELKFNLRGIDHHASFYRLIHIVVGDKMSLPPWLNTHHPKIRIVRHSQIFDPQFNSLPTFNSHAIEARLHFIPGLAEHFVYANDDQFIYRDTSPWTFFNGHGQARVWTGGYKMSFQWSDGHTVAVKNTNYLTHSMRQHWSDNDNTLLHQVKPLTIDMMHRAKEKFSHKWWATEQHPFRHNEDIWPVLLSAINCVEDNHCRISSPPSSYFENLKTDTIRHVFDEVQSKHPTLVCLNDSSDGAKDPLVAQLTRLFPHKSRFEY